MNNMTKSIGITSNTWLVLGIRQDSAARCENRKMIDRKKYACLLVDCLSIDRPPAHALTHMAYDDHVTSTER